MIINNFFEEYKKNSLIGQFIFHFNFIKDSIYLISLFILSNIFLSVLKNFNQIFYFNQDFYIVGYSVYFLFTFSSIIYFFYKKMPIFKDKNLFQSIIFIYNMKKNKKYYSEKNHEYLLLLLKKYNVNSIEKFDEIKNITFSHINHSKFTFKGLFNFLKSIMIFIFPPVMTAILNNPKLLNDELFYNIIVYILSLFITFIMVCSLVLTIKYFFNYVTNSDDVMYNELYKDLENIRFEFID